MRVVGPGTIHAPVVSPISTASPISPAASRTRRQVSLTTAGSRVSARALSRGCRWTPLAPASAGTPYGSVLDRQEPVP